MLQKSNPICAGVTLGALAASLLPVRAFDLESADKWMSYGVGAWRFRPELQLTTEFTDNVYYAGLTAKHYVFKAVPLVVPSGSGGYQYSGLYVADGQRIGAANGGIFYDQTGKQYKAGESYNGPVSPGIPINGVQVQTAANKLYANGGELAVSPRNSELISSATPGFKVIYGEEVLNYFSLSYGVTLSKYLVSGVEPDPQHSIRTHFKFEEGRVKLELDSVAQLSSSYLAAGQNFTIQRSLVNRWGEDSSARVTYEVSPRISAYAEFKHDLVDYDSVVPLYGSASWQGNLGASYAISDNWRLFSESEYGQTTISPSTTDIPNGPHSVIYGAYVGMQGTFTPRFSGLAKMGFEVRSYPSIGSDGAGAPAFDINVTYAAGPVTQLNLAYSRRTSPSSQIAAQTYVFDNVAFSATQGLGGTGYWWTTFSTRYNRGDFSSRIQTGSLYDQIPGTSLYALRTALLDYARTDDQIVVSMALKYIPRPWLAVTLSYEYETYIPSFRDSRLDGIFLPEYDNHRVTLSLNLGY